MSDPLRLYLCHACQNEWAEIYHHRTSCPYCASTDFVLLRTIP